MSLTRSTLGSAFLRPFVRRSAPVCSHLPLSGGQRTYATGDYGSGEGDPKGEDPLNQGVSASADKEHPGPSPPKAAKGGSSPPAKDSSSSSSSSSSSGGKDTSSSSSSESAKDESSTKGAQPKLKAAGAPAESEQSEEVKQHNKDMDKRAEQSYVKADDADIEKDKVKKPFW